MNMTPTINSKKAAKSGRQTNNSLSSSSGAIYIDNFSKSKNLKKKKANETKNSAEAIGNSKKESNGKTEKKAARSQAKGKNATMPGAA